jgi:leucyl-tRNA synthetase
VLGIAPLNVEISSSEATIRAQALALPPVAKYVENRTIKSIFIVPHKVVNIVTE